jgi:hypothetical protein
VVGGRSIVTCLNPGRTMGTNIPPDRHIDVPLLPEIASFSRIAGPRQDNCHLARADPAWALSRRTVWVRWFRVRRGNHGDRRKGIYAQGNSPRGNCMRKTRGFTLIELGLEPGRLGQQRPWHKVHIQTLPSHRCRTEPPTETLRDASVAAIAKQACRYQSLMSHTDVPLRRDMDGPIRVYSWEYRYCSICIARIS